MIISHIRNTSNELLYNFLLDATNETYENTIVWSNQQVFNKLDFQFEMLYTGPELENERPIYVHDFEVGIVTGDVSVQIYNHQGGMVD